jgi:GPH family glycoside/pentoside/hexuronide:cation symporter
VKKVSKSALASFGMSGLAQNIVGTCLGVHLFMFYTDVVGLSPLWVSAGLFVATMWDAVLGVWMGRISDRTRWRSGRRRPWLLIGALPYAAAFVALLMPPAALSGPALGIYFVLMLVILNSAGTIVQVPTLSLLPEMARDYDDRTRMAASRELLGNVGDLLGLLLPLAILLALGFRGEPDPNARGLAQNAFAIAALAIGAIALASLAIVHRGTREDRRARAAERTSWIEAFGALRNNRAFRILLGASALGALGLAFVQTMILYVLEHVMHERDPAIQMAAFVTNALAAIGSYPLWMRLAKRRGKPTAFRIGLIASTLTFASVFAAGPGATWLLFAVMIFSGVANVGFWMLLSSLSADVTDLDELESGQRREGLFAGFFALIRKCAFALAAAGVGVGLTVVGYRENAEQSAETIFGLKLLFALPPTLLLVLAFAIFRRFPLTRTAHARIVRRLEARQTRAEEIAPLREAA